MFDCNEIFTYCCVKFVFINPMNYYFYYYSTIFFFKQMCSELKRRFVEQNSWCRLSWTWLGSLFLKSCLIFSALLFSWQGPDCKKCIFTKRLKKNWFFSVLFSKKWKSETKTNQSVCQSQRLMNLSATFERDGEKMREGREWKTNCETFWVLADYLDSKNLD